MRRRHGGMHAVMSVNLSKLKISRNNRAVFAHSRPVFEALSPDGESLACHVEFESDFGRARSSVIKAETQTQDFFLTRSQSREDSPTLLSIS